uniref:RdRp catalytic domain-containing protein n=1 Tax=Trichuris muris TaxID=70415 RepID=A0A5S6QT28_TRIMR
MCDVIDQRFLCNLGFQLFAMTMPEIYTVTADDILELYAWGDCLLIDRKNEAYNVLKFFEPLCMACLLEKTDVCGLSETFVKGCMKVQAVGKRAIQMDHETLRLIYACLVKEFCINYIRLEGRWPRLTFANPEKNRIAQLYARHQLNWIENEGHAELDEWSQVFVLKNFEFDYCLDYTQILDDKAISTYKSHWDQVYDETMLEGLTKDNRMNPPASATVWYEDGSGKEGIRQKGWTLATVGALLLVESITGVFGTITGQGDNQVVVAMFEVPPGQTRETYVRNAPEEIKARVEAYMSKLASVFNSIGLPVKKEESWVHLDIFAY